MLVWPELGTRVSVRYRRPAGSVPPLTDVVGHLLSVGPTVRVRTKNGAITTFAPADAVALRTLADLPVRTAQIRNLEHAAAAAWPADENEWLAGWLLRAGTSLSTNSAVPLDISAKLSAIPSIVDWYRQRGRPPRLAVPDRLLPLPTTLATEHTEQVLVCELISDPQGCVVTEASDGTRWVGLPTAAGCAASLSRGASRGYLALGEDQTREIESARTMGFRLHHRRRYVRLPESST